MSYATGGAVASHVVMAARGGNNHYHREDDDVAANVLHFIAQHVLVPPLYIVLLGSVSACLLNALCNYVAHEPRVLVHSFAAWRRVLRLSTETHVVTPPPAPPPTRVTTPQRRTPATATVSVQQQLHKRNGNGNSNRHNNKQHRDVYERASGHSVASWRTRTASAYVDDDTAASTPTRAPRRASYNVEDEDSVFDRAACMNNNNKNNDNDGNSCRHVGTMYDSAAFFRVMDGMAAHSPTTAQLASMAATTTASAAAAAAAASSTAGAARTTAMATDECPPAVVPAPVVAEALTRSLADVRRAHQRRVFAYHPNFMIAAAVKSFVMLIVIQYYFDSIPGGWHRLCVCGTANVMSGLLMPVLEYTANLLLPLDATPSQASVAAGVVVGAAAAAVATASSNGGNSGGSGSNGNGKGDGSGGAVGDGEDASKDRALFAELLLSIARLELSSLSTVLVQGSLFVCFAAILLPVLVVLCIPGAVLYVWLLLPPWVVYAALRHVYYRGATRQPTATSHSSIALLWFVWELLKMTAMKVLTLWLLQVSLQTTLLLGLSFIEQRTYTDALRDAVAPQVVRRYPHGPVNAFRLLCVVSQLVL